jgi:hypothetical protein
MVLTCTSHGHAPYRLAIDNFVSKQMQTSASAYVIVFFPRIATLPSNLCGPLTTRRAWLDESLER